MKLEKEDELRSVHAESPEDTINEPHESVTTSTDGLVVTREAKVQTVDAHMDFFDEDQFFTDHAKTHYHTGLPNGEVLLATFNYIVPYPGTRLLLVVLD